MEDEQAEPKVKHISREPLNWRQIFVEFLAVVFGVLLGLSLNEWRVNVHQDEAIQQSLKSLQTEIKTNYNSIKTARDYHIAIYNELQKISEGQLTFSKSKFRGIRPPPMQTAAYQIALQRGVFTEVTQQSAIDIVNIYTKQDALKGLFESYANGLIGTISNDPTDAKTGKLLLRAVRDFLFTEDDIVNEMNTYLNQPNVSPWFEELRAKSRKSQTKASQN